MFVTTFYEKTHARFKCNGSEKVPSLSKKCIATKFIYFEVQSDKPSFLNPKHPAHVPPFNQTPLHPLPLHPPFLTLSQQTTKIGKAKTP